MIGARTMGSATGQKRMVELPDSGRPGSESPDIPRLEEVEGAALGYQSGAVAQAPTVAVNRVSTFRELDSALMKHAAFSSLEDIDLSLLTKYLCPESDVRDEEVAWTWDYLYTSICSELRNDWEGDEEEDEENTDTGPDAPNNSRVNTSKRYSFEKAEGAMALLS